MQEVCGHHEFQASRALKIPQIAVKKYLVGSSVVLHFREFKAIAQFPPWKIWFLHSHILGASWQTRFFFFSKKYLRYAEGRDFMKNSSY